MNERTLPDSRTHLSRNNAKMTYVFCYPASNKRMQISVLLVSILKLRKVYAMGSRKEQTCCPEQNF